MDKLEKKKILVRQLKAYYEGDSKKVQKLADNCKFLDFPLSEEENMDSIAKHPAEFMTIIAYSDFGVLDKIKQTIDKLKYNKL